MNDNHKGGAKILPFGIPTEIEGPSGRFHSVDVWQCKCGHTLFTYSKQFGMVCDECNEPQAGFEDA